MQTPDLAYSVSGIPRRGTIVAFHGVTDSAASLHDLASHFNSEWQVYLVDTLGHGLSPRFSRDQLAQPFESILAAAERLLVKAAARAPRRTVVVMGHSLGGAIAAHLAIAHPELIEALVLEDPALLTPEQAQVYQTAADQLVKTQQSIRQAPGEAITILQQSYPRWPASEVPAWAQGKIEVDLDFVRTGVVGSLGRDLLDSLMVPTVLISGDGDDVLFDADALSDIRTRGTAPIETVHIDHASHTVRRDQSEAFYAHVDAFLDSVLSSRTPDQYFIDPELEPLIADVPEQTTWDPKKMREHGERLLGAGAEIPDGVTMHVETVDGIEVRLITATPHPSTIIFAPHGGGYVAGRARYDDARNCELATLIPGAVVVSPDYRLAPEYPQPAALNDCLAALSYATTRYPHASVVLFGDSAGSGLVREILDAAPDSLFEKISQVIVLEPCIDSSLTSRSYAVFDGPVWTHEAAAAAWHEYLGHDAAQLAASIPSGRQRDPRTCRAYPPVMIIVNPVDPLRDEGIAWAESLIEAGIRVELHMPAGTYHGSLSVPGTRVWALVRGYVTDFLAGTGK